MPFGGSKKRINKQLGLERRKSSLGSLPSPSPPLKLSLKEQRPRLLERLGEACFQEFAQLGRGLELWDGV
jgi:hypothetical protein